MAGGGGGTPAIQETTCGVVPVSTAILLGTPAPVWFIRNGDDSAVANGVYPGSSGAGAAGWSVSAGSGGLLVCPPIGTTRAPLYKVHTDVPTGDGNTYQSSDGTFTVSPAPAGCARPAPPVFTAAVQGANIKLTGTG